MANLIGIWLQQWRRGRLPSLVALATPLVLACGGSNNLQPAALANPDSLYWRLELNQHVVTLSDAAPYDTLTVTAMPQNYRGEVLAGLPAPKYTSTDIEHVLVGQDGKLVAVAPNDLFHLTKVVVSLTVGNLTSRDSVWVYVAHDATPPEIERLSIHPVPPDSAKIGAPGSDAPFQLCGHLPLQVIGPGGVLLDNSFPVFVRSSDTTVVAIAIFGGQGESGVLDLQPQNCQVYARRTGVATLYATTTILGVTKADTLQYRVGWPVLSMVHIVPTEAGSPVNTFLEPQRTVGVGAIVFWNSAEAQTETAVMFTDPTNVASPGSQDILHNMMPNTFPPGFQTTFCQFTQIDCDAAGDFAVPPEKYWGNARIFPVAGTYEYHTPEGANARIVVAQDP